VLRCGIIRNASILLAILAGAARQIESRPALAIAAKMAAFRVYSVLSARETRTNGNRPRQRTRRAEKHADRTSLDGPSWRLQAVLSLRRLATA
jgi:hypothetical protein